MRIIYFFILFIATYISNAQTAFTYIDTSNSDIPDNWVRAVYTDDAGNIWVGTEGGLGKLDPANNWTVFTTANSGIPGNEILSVFADADTIWVGTQLNGMGKFDGTTWTTFDPGNSEIPDFQIQSIIKDINDTMWIGSQGGFTKWDGADYWYTYTAENSLLKSNSILDIYIDAADIKYLGTLNGGLSLYDHGFISTYRKDNSDISDNTVLQITEDADHNKWLATSFGGLSLFTPDLEFLNFTPTSSDISDWTVNDVELDADGNGLLTMPVTGLDIFENPDWQHYNNDNSAISDSLTRLIIDDDNIAWIGTQERGLVKFDRSLLAVNDEQMQNEIMVYPDPATTCIIVEGKYLNNLISIFSMDGKIMYAENVSGNNVFIDVRDFPAGNYILGISGDQQPRLTHFAVMH